MPKRILPERINRPAQKQAIYPSAKCNTCPLANARLVRNDIVEPDPSVTTKPLIIAIGEGPARTEVEVGHNFAGASGQILREGCKANGLNKYGIVLENAVACDTRSIKQAYGDDPGVIAEKKKLLRQAVEACSDRLWDTIKQVDPKLLIVFGREAKEAVTPEVTGSILTLVGETHKTAEGWNIVYCWHPAFIMHDEDGERLISEFMSALNEARLFFEAIEIETEVRIARTTTQALAFIRQLSKHDRIVVDIETTSFYPWDDGVFMTPSATDVQRTVAIASGYTLRNDKMFSNGQLISIQIAPSAGLAYVFPVACLDVPRIKAALIRLLAKKKLIVHNAMFDLVWLGAKLGIPLKCTDDTMMMSYSQDESPFHSLKRLGRERLGVRDWSEDVSFWRAKRSVSYAAVPEQVLFEYGGRDTAITYAIQEPLRRDWDTDSRRLYENWLVPVTNMLCRAAVRGIGINATRLRDVAVGLEQRRLDLGGEILENWGLKNANSSVATRRVVLEHFQMDLPDDTTTGKNLLEPYRLKPYQKKTVPDWEWELSEFALKVLEYRSVYKALNTYAKDVANSVGFEDVTRMPSGDIMLYAHPDFQMWKTVTGRIVIQHPTITNYSKATIHADVIREPFQARPGYKWVHMDRKQFELRVYGNLMHDSRMEEILSKPGADGKDRDPHTEIGFLIYGADYLKKNKDSNGFLRIVVKQCVFGRLYNRQPAAIAEQLDIAIEEAEHICEVIDTYFAELGTYRKDITERIMRDQRLINPIGRSRRFPLVTNDNWVRCLNMGCNYMIQSTASDLHLEAVYAATLEFPTFEPLFTIHDSVELEVPEDDLDKLDDYVQFTNEYPMRHFPGAKIPFKVDVKVGTRWPSD